MHHEKNDDLEGSLIGYEAKEISDETEETIVEAKQSLIRNWHLISAITVYCVFALQDMAYSEVA